MKKTRSPAQTHATAKSTTSPRTVYVIGAGFSAGLGFPTIGNLLPRMWSRIEAAGFANEMASIVRFHHPSFNPARPDSYPSIEELLSEMQANSQLFDSSRPATGNFTSAGLEKCRQMLLLELAKWFHELQREALATPKPWLDALVDRMKAEEAQIISFNWDLVLDQMLFGAELKRSSYGFARKLSGPTLIKPHGSLNWYRAETGRFLSDAKKFRLAGENGGEIYAFKPFRSPLSSKREYMPLIVPPVFMKEFQEDIFRSLWQRTVSLISTASEVRFIGYSLPTADFHARFILRCGFHNQEAGALRQDGRRAAATGRAKVTIVDPDTTDAVSKRIGDAVGWRCDHFIGKVEDWVLS
ncbi:hypothetical protein HFO82_27480 [Rhizobium leguminosarum]|uniref:hypothetical protein n=1 Tax=Rhizobium leguminosarum TaxID=384 RepID=UPI001C93F4F3|nr:hypothetical protein [Rhizobium leguminosarum]MBY5502336.1 hypothetical protein [Rhizobium leguminosarum]